MCFGFLNFITPSGMGFGFNRTLKGFFDLDESKMGKEEPGMSNTGFIVGSYERRVKHIF